MSPAHRAPRRATESGPATSVNPGHRAPGLKLSRRHVLGLAALAAVPAATIGVLQFRSDDTAAEATNSPGRPPSTPPSASAPPKVVTEGGGVVPFRPGQAMLGAYLGLSGKTPAQARQLRREQLGREERIEHVFYGWADQLPASFPDLPSGAFPMVSWRGTKFTDITSGAGDEIIKRAARRLKSVGRPLLLRWGWEMNGDWYAWSPAKNGKDPAGYVQSWRRLHGIFADEGVTNVAWVWSPNWNSSPVADWNTYAALYPGDKYVDWVGVSGYNLRKESPDTLFGPVYRSYAARKPIMISEVGSVDRGGRTKADWITLFGKWVEAHPAVGAVTWFDTDTHPDYAEKWRIDTDAASLAAYRAMAASARFSG
ncbi:glycoside hydrolase family 26 protein [Actinoplanes sp. NPDC051859]|uniref:glycoside hydrolase family 26 protein n=1 Tax=Actinoplanes sp. NPDC051859 TaxID=3363909 RepID=UPI00379C5A7A